MATYAALIYEPAGRDGHRDPAIVEEYRRFMAEAAAAGVLITGHPLESPDLARSVRLAGGTRDGAVTVTDGPFAETKEVLAGFFLLDCDDLETATSWAARMPHAWLGTMEVRPVAD